MQITKTISGHRFTITLSNIASAGELANGAIAYEASVTIYCDGKHVGAARWEPEGFAAGGPDLLHDSDASEDAYSELATAVRERLAKPERVEPEQPWRVAGDDRDLEVESVDGDEAALRTRSRFTDEWLPWGRAPVESMLTLSSWTFLGAAEKPEGMVLAL